MPYSGPHSAANRASSGWYSIWWHRWGGAEWAGERTKRIKEREGEGEKIMFQFSKKKKKKSEFWPSAHAWTQNSSKLPNTVSEIYFLIGNGNCSLNGSQEGMKMGKIGCIVPKHRLSGKYLARKGLNNTFFLVIANMIFTRKGLSKTVWNRLPFLESEYTPS